MATFQDDTAELHARTEPAAFAPSRRTFLVGAGLGGALAFGPALIP